MQQISFVEFLGCMMNMCLLGYYAIMVRAGQNYENLLINTGYKIHVYFSQMML